MNSTSTSLSFTISKHHGGTLSVLRDSGSVASASISGSTVNVSRSGTSSGVVKFTVTSAQTEYYTSASTTYTLTVQQRTMQITMCLSTNIAGGGSYTSDGNYTIPYRATSRSIYNQWFTTTNHWGGCKDKGYTYARWKVGAVNSGYVTINASYSKDGTTWNNFASGTLRAYGVGTASAVSPDSSLSNGAWYQCGNYKK